MIVSYQDLFLDKKLRFRRIVKTPFTNDVTQILVVFEPPSLSVKLKLTFFLTSFITLLLICEPPSSLNIVNVSYGVFKQSKFILELWQSSYT
jgi:hypothetical protein